MTSESVSLANSWPLRASVARSSRKFSMMPLCTMAMRPVQSRCGWAFLSVGAPCVAQRVWAMPVVPTRLAVAQRSSRTATRPAHLTPWSSPSVESTSTPAESYPRYSSVFSPSMR